MPELPKSFLTLPLRSNGSFPGVQADKSCLVPCSLNCHSQAPPGESVGLQGSKQLIWDEQVRRRVRKGVPVTFQGGMYCSVGEERRLECGRCSPAPGISGETEKVQIVSWLGKVQRCEG